MAVTAKLRVVKALSQKLRMQLLVCVAMDQATLHARTPRVQADHRAQHRLAHILRHARVHHVDQAADLDAREI